MHHNISPWNGASAAVHVCLAPLAFIPILLTASGTPAQQKQKDEGQDLFSARLHSVTDLMGRNGVAVAVSPLHALPEYEKEGEILVDRCEKQYCVKSQSQ